MLRFTDNERKFGEAKGLATQIIKNLHYATSDDWETAMQAVEMAFMSLLEEKHNPKDVLKACVLLME